MHGLTRTFASVALALGLVGCDVALPPPPEPTPPLPATTPTGTTPTSTPVSSAPVGTTTVPRLVGRTIAEATTRLGASGLVANDQDGGPGYACVAADVVMFQHPSPGRTLPQGRKVLVVPNGPVLGTCGLELPPASPHLRRAARAFAGFARAKGHDRRALSEHPIDLYVGGRYARTLAVERQPEARSWDLCPGGLSYAGRVCPVSVLDAINGYPARLAITTRARAHACAHPSPLPAALNGYERVTLTPDESRDCTSYFGVQLLVGDDGEVAAVNLVLSEP